MGRELFLFDKLYTYKKSSYAANKNFSPIKRAAMLQYGTFLQ
ncbi:MAG: hypothetical protein ABF652_07280 [Clostridium beijerinckii]